MTFTQKLLSHFSITEEEYSRLILPSETLILPNYQQFSSIDTIIERIKLAMNLNEKIVIYGDYDCDGIMATSILVKTFEMLNYQVGYYVPNRYIDGYGLNVDKVVEFADKGYSLIITVDNGISQFLAINKAQEFGIDVIVTDHHLPGSELPQALAIMHPQLSGYGPINCCGAYVAFMLATALLGREDGYLLSLASIATISDMMPLLSYNRDIVRKGIFYINKYRYPAIMSLIEVQSIDEDAIALGLAPKINSIGRIIENSNINRLIKFFTTKDAKKMQEIGDWICQTNELRKVKTKEVIEKLHFDRDKPAIIIYDPLCKEGLIGLIANRLVCEYEKPVVVFTSDCLDPQILIGSARSREGFNIANAFAYLRPLLINSGGHSLAGGLSIRIDDYSLFCEQFYRLAEEHLVLEEEEKIIDIELAEVNKENYELLSQFAPFGNSWKKPIFAIKKLASDSCQFISSGRHLLIPLSVNISIIGFNIAKNSIINNEYFDVHGQLRTNEYRRNLNLQFVITRIIN